MRVGVWARPQTQDTLCLGMEEEGPLSLQPEHQVWCCLYGQPDLSWEGVELAWRGISSYCLQLVSVSGSGSDLHENSARIIPISDGEKEAEGLSSD